MESPSKPLLDLPADVLRHICYALCHHCSLPSSLPVFHCELSDDGIFRNTNQDGINTLNSLSKTCRTLRDIAQPIMYHAPIIYSFSRFIKTLVERPDLASAVKVYQYLFRVREYGLNYPSWAVYEDTAYVIDMAHSLSIMDVRDTFQNVLFFQGELAKGLENAIQTTENVAIRDRCAQFILFQLCRYDSVAQHVALALLPNLEVVVVSNTAEDDLRGMAGMVIEQDAPGYLAPVRAAPTCVWPHLRTLVIEDVVGAGRGYEMDASLFRLPHFGDLIKQSPNLENLVLINTSDTEGERPLNDDELSLPLNGIRSITVHGSGVEYLGEGEEVSPRAYLAGLISTCPKLERLSIRPRKSEINAWNEPSKFSPLRTIQDARAARKTLTHLALYSSYVRVHEDVLEKGLGSILDEFTALKSLVIDEQCFCRHWPLHKEESSHLESDEQPLCLTSSLPQTVTDLTVRLHDKLRAVDDVAELGRQVALGEFPRLSRLVVKFVDEKIVKAKLGMYRERLVPGEPDSLGESGTYLQPDMQASADKYGIVIKEAWRDTSVDITVQKVVEDVFCSALPYGRRPFHHGHHGM